MASQIYSRYVPLSKKKSSASLPISNPAPSKSILESSSSTPLATRPDASATYVRYIPPSKRKQAPNLPAIPSVDLQLLSPKLKRKPAVLEEQDQEASPVKSNKLKRKLLDEPISTPTLTPNHGQTSDPATAGEPAVSDVNYEEEGANREEAGRDTGPSADGSQVRDNGKLSNSKTPKKRKKDEFFNTGSKAGSEIAGVRKEDEESEEEDTARHKKLLKKREKSMKKAENLASKETEEPTTGPSGEVHPLLEAEEVHGLVPLPQPEPVPEPPAPLITASLPPWLASPIRVPPTSTSRFPDLGLSRDIASALHERGFSEALAIQAAVLPLLLPGKPQQPGDVLVSAATGSGKTLAYVLPMIEDVSRNRHAGIQGLIVLPTRELVAQVRQVCEVCASVFSKIDGYTHRPIIGTAVGSETMQAEQDALIGEELIFDPVGYDEELKAANASWESSDQATERELFPKQEFKSRIPGHVIRPFLKVDVLICTPGRLVEHLRSTPGFSIHNIRWLVVDEADKLLDQSFQQWLNTVMGRIHSNRRHIRDRVRKIILSATMTSDIGQLTSLKLYRPKLVVLEGSSSDGTDSAHRLALPSLLKESGVKVEDEIIKPLYLIELLRRANLVPAQSHPVDEFSSSDTDSSGSDSESDPSTSESDSDSDSASSVASSDPIHLAPSRSGADTQSVLIFTKSNETAVRLSRLISLLCPQASSKLGTLTSTTPRQSRQRTISSFSSHKTTILVASDLVSRGLDLPNLGHVINYDVPTSLTSYVHRIGRTARAGKEGHAWTLFTGSEAGWFWREIARNEKIQRVGGAKVERVNIKKETFDQERQKYENALETLEMEASNRSGKQDEV